MSISYELDSENPSYVMKVEFPTDGEPRDVAYDDEGNPIPGTGYVPRIATSHGALRDVASVETADAITYHHTVCDLATGEYTKDAENTAPIEIEGVSYPLDASGQVVIPKVRPLMAFSQAQAVMSARTMGVALPLAQEAEAQVVIAMTAGLAPAEKASADWTPGEYVGIGTVRTYGGTEYSCVQPHVTQAGWTPDIVPALWSVVSAGPEESEWRAGEPVEVGYVRTYGGVRYTCITAHTTQAGWTPDAVPALWSAAQ